MTPGIFSGRSVFLTGHTGFKGSWLALWLHKLGARVTGYSLRPPSEPSNFEVSRIRDTLISHHEADIRDDERLASALKASPPDVVFHLAAQPLVRESYLAPRETFDVNVLGTAGLLDAVRRTGKPCAVVVVTSDKCYMNNESGRAYREGDPLGGLDPYSASKGAAEILIESYRNSFFNPADITRHKVKLASARAGNVIGGGDWAKDRVVVDAMKALSKKQPVNIRNPRSIRPWQHVLEPLSGYLTLAARMLESSDAQWCNAWNFGPQTGDECTVGELAEKICQAWGDGSWNDCSNDKHPHEAKVLRLSIDKAVEQMSWRPRWRLDETVSRTVNWYKQFYSNSCPNMRETCLADIEAYEAAEVPPVLVGPASQPAVSAGAAQ